ncbi:MAG: discoidin domain-containing protein [Deltaproteobacteria bacterium]|nr:discoidin domain-containing protein [Deltaproteobacteria bacterium]
MSDQTGAERKHTRIVSFPAPQDHQIERTDVSADDPAPSKRGFAARYIRPFLKATGYMLFLFIAVALILMGLEQTAKYALKRSHFGQAYPDDFSKVRLDFTRPVSYYDYDLSPGVCLIYNQQRGNRLEYANNAGFREPRPIMPDKPDDEFRIFLTGGSTAFGLGSSGQAAALTDYYEVEYRETISYFMERILNASAPIQGKTIRVYNTAVWGHSYQHLLTRYLVKLRQFSPDLIVSLDGVNEIAQVSRPAKDWNYFKEGQYNNIIGQIFSYDAPGLSSYLTLWLKNNSYLMTLFWSGNDLFQNFSHKAHPNRGAPQDSEEFKLAQSMSRDERSKMLTENVSTVVRMVENYHSVLENDGVPHIFALQPLLYLSQKPRHEVEKKVEAVAEHQQSYDVPAAHGYKYIVDRIAHSAATKGYFVADFSDYFDDVSEWVFTDWCHLTAGANYLIAKELANLVKEQFFKRSLSEGDAVEAKNSFFWNSALTARIQHAPPADRQDNESKNILGGYPAPPVYESREVSLHEPLEVILDLTHDFTLSRLRVFWADDASVPEEWAVDVSMDGKEWKEWASGTNKSVDHYSLWPGYDYFAATPVRARYLKYRPVKFEERRIRLRSLNVYR